MSFFANLLQDPPPTHAFELSEDGIAFAPVAEPGLAGFQRFEPGVLLVSPLHDNIQQPQVLLDHIQSLAPANGHRKRRAAVILPDYCARWRCSISTRFQPIWGSSRPWFAFG